MAPIVVNAGTTLSANGVIAAPLVNNGTVVVGSGHAAELRGPVSGTGTVQVAAGGALQIDGATAASETIVFAGPLGAVTLAGVGTGVGATVAAPILGLAVGDELVLGGAAQILNVQTTGAHSALIQTRSGTIILANIGFAAGASPAFLWFKNPATGLWTLEVASPSVDWTGAAGDGLVGSGANWRDDRTKAQAVPNSADSLTFDGVGGTLTGAVAGLDASFGGTGAWVLNSATLSLAGHPSLQGPAQAMLAGAGMTLNGSTIEAGGSITVGAYGGVRVALASGSRIDAVGLVLAPAANQSATVALASGTVLTDSGAATIGGIGAGTLAINGGTVTTQGLSVLGGPSLGASSHGTGVATIAAGGIWTASGGLQLGVAGTGTLTVATGGAVHVLKGLTAGQAGAAVVTLSGGSLNTDTLTVGGHGAVGVAPAGVLTAVQGITIAAGGTVALQPGGSVLASGVTSAGLLLGAGTLTAGTLVNNGTIAASGGTLVVNARLSGTGTLAIARGAELYLAGSLAAGETIQFQPGPGTLAVANPALVAGGTIMGFAPGDRILLAGAGPVSETYDPKTGTLRLTGPGGTLALHVAGAHAAPDFLGAAGTMAPLPGLGDVTVVAAAGARLQPSAGQHTLILQGGGDTVVAPASGQGLIDILGPATGGMKIDFTQALTAAGWTGNAGTLGNFLSIASAGGAPVVAITPAKGGGAPALRLEGQAGLSLAGLLAEAVV